MIAATRLLVSLFGDARGAAVVLVPRHDFVTTFYALDQMLFQ
jgi:hypothetical protein